MRHAFAAIAACTALLLSRAASAQGARPETAWYGWKHLIPDVASMTAMTIGYVAGERTFAVAGVTTYVLSGPTIHLLHEQPGRAGLSLVGRVVGPFLVAGILLGSCSKGESCKDWALGGFAAGVVIASLHDVVTSEEKVTAEASLTVSVSPRGTPTLGVVGRFCLSDPA